MIGRIFKTSYHVDGDDLIFDIYGRNEDKEKCHLEVYGTEPYFFTNEKPKVLKHESGVKKIVKEDRNLEGDELYKVKTELPSDVGRVKNLVAPHLEADIPYRKRVRFDHGWKQYIEYPENSSIYTPSDIEGIEYNGRIEPNICVADIEVWDKRGSRALDTENTSEEIVSVSLHDSYLDKYCLILSGDYDGEGYKPILDRKIEEANIDISYDARVVTVPNENQLLLKLKEWFAKSKLDIFTGWNFKKYDFPYIRGRVQKVLNPSSMQWLSMPATFDLMKGNSKISRSKTRNKLEVQAKRILGVGKLKTPAIHEMYEENRDLLIAYNLLDTILAKEINEVNGVLKHYTNLSRFCGIDVTNLVRMSDTAEGYIFHKLEELSGDVKVRLLSKKHVESSDEKVSGGHVGDAKEGIFELVAVIDYKSEYPMIICEFNISPDTYEPNPDPDKDYYVSPNGNHYRKDEEGIVPKIMKELLEERNKVKKKMREAKRNNETRKYKRLDNEQNAIKVVMNSFYGLMSSPGSVFRLSNKKCGDDITTIAREHVEFTSDVMKELDYDKEKEVIVDDV